MNNNALRSFCSDTSEGFQPTQTLREHNTSIYSQADRWKKMADCPACVSSNIIPFATIRNISYHRCRKCGFTFANPVPPSDVLAEFYNSPFYNNYRKLESERIQSEPYYSVSAYTDLRRLAGWLDRGTAINILDFGCGPGSFLAILRDEFGFQSVEGLEINAESTRMAQSKYSLHLASDISELQDKHFDVVILHEVIEHVADPGGLLAIVSGLIKPSGRLLITTPSVRNFPGRFFPAHCGHYTGPSHISLFTENALRGLLSRLNFRIERMEIDVCTQILGYFILSPVYNLDFASPRSVDDCNDMLLIPTRLGSAFGLTPRRSPGRFGTSLTTTG